MLYTRRTQVFGLHRTHLGAGGGAHLRGLDTMLREEIGIPVFVAEDPLLAVVKGAGMVVEDVESYKGILL